MAERIYAIVHKVNGKCKFWKEGDEIVFIVDPKTRMIGLDMEATKGKAACVAALATIYPYVLTPRTWTAAMKYDYYTCPDPGPAWDGCGGVVFKVDREKRQCSKG
jgi:uncharacterized repeat protein (TIGR04076 family)